MGNQENYKTVMKLLISFIWVMYGLKVVFTISLLLSITPVPIIIIPIIMEFAILVLLTLIVVVLNNSYLKTNEDQDYRGEKHKTGKRKQLEKELKKSGFDPDNLKDYLKE